MTFDQALVSVKGGQKAGRALYDGRAHIERRGDTIAYVCADDGVDQDYVAPPWDLLADDWIVLP